MTEVTPHPLKTQGFHHFLILLFYGHPAKERFFFAMNQKWSVFGNLRLRKCRSGDSDDSFYRYCVMMRQCSHRRSRENVALAGLVDGRQTASRPQSGSR